MTAARTVASDPAKINASTTTKSWRDVVEIHPAAEMFPLMNPTEIKALGNDIRRNGLRIPTIWWRDHTTHKLYLLDGRNRLDAMEAIGRNLVNYFAAPCDRWPLNLNSDHLYELPLPGRSKSYPDPYEYVLSANIHRRHLNAEQKRELIAKLLQAKPEQSNVAIAKVVKADDKTVAKVRHELEARSEIPNVEVRTDTKGRKQPARRTRGKRITSGLPEALAVVVDPDPAEHPESTIWEPLDPKRGVLNPITRAWIKATKSQQIAFALDFREVIAGLSADEQRRLERLPNRRGLGS
jgi:hypothetical protein